MSCESRVEEDAQLKRMNEAQTAQLQMEDLSDAKKKREVDTHLKWLEAAIPNG